MWRHLNKEYQHFQLFVKPGIQDYYVSRHSWYSFYQPQKDERLSLPWSHPVVLNRGHLDWESSALTTWPLHYIGHYPIRPSSGPLSGHHQVIAPSGHPEEYYQRFQGMFKRVSKNVPEDFEEFSRRFHRMFKKIRENINEDSAGC